MSVTIDPRTFAADVHDANYAKTSKKQASLIARDYADLEALTAQAQLEYPDMFVGDSIDMFEVAVQAKNIAKRISLFVSRGDQAVLLWASYLLAKQCGWKPGNNKEGK